MAEERQGDSAAAEILLEKVKDIDEKLGIGHPRHPWVDRDGLTPEGPDGGERDDA